MQKRCVYKIKESSKEQFAESYISEYVYVYDFANNPLEEYCQYFAYRHIFIDNL